MALLEVKNLDVRFAVRGGDLKAIRGISFSLDKGERLGLVGESGAGKSVAAFSILNLIARPGYIAGGEILFEGRNLAAMSERELRKIRGDRIAMIFQDPMMTLNPVLTVGTQMVEALKAHRRISTANARKIALERLKQVQIPSPEKRLDQYPHELSGGMRQRVIIAIALLLDPEIIIADEPTTALDVTIQAEIMALLLELCEQHNVALMLITHDLGVVSQVSQRMLVMYAGRVIEQGPTKEIINDAQHPYTQGLINALPQMGEPGRRLFQIPGSMPSLNRIPTGCPFNPRCQFANDHCREVMPEYVRSGNVDVACHEVAALIEKEKQLQEEQP
ncbi:MAG: methionine ABC transporter ATP-binding protein [Alteromonadaceae bacterium]|uniref:ABC transporter ATP-binding protein n=1 Tax=unclassified Marinobacter TaxID=83889 RepID=UPI000C43CB0A|nr:ABC transporter ATP-binding protein [Marinobacter sp. BGYM27]MAA64204.1 methionine ABC transporter ATP-binding protein [Alteromonadaceae bacterium]MBH86988.1 methionine ABC transporter ATP-binding protein [Alteromonadaceae bacterium]MDG5500942.1 ABC transporter ATP-binding protein [Marinobacter sp. BGYM27]|tara:strand:- start:3879 stop:4877 length:999 start_codon:yes stop_codon:yes gene_type:complete